MESQNNNFQTAASAIDASVKIFAARVDSVHQETFKLQSGLNRTDGGAMGRDGAAQDGADEGSQGRSAAETRPAAKRKTGRMASTLVKSSSDIDAAAFEMQYEEDPLIKKASAAFDSGGSRGLLLNQLGTYAGCTLVFDSGDAPQDAGRRMPTEDASARLAATTPLAEQLATVLARIQTAELGPEARKCLSEAGGTSVRRADDDALHSQLAALPPAHESNPGPHQYNEEREEVPMAAIMGDDDDNNEAPHQHYDDDNDDFGDFGNAGGSHHDDLDDAPRDFDADGNIVDSPSSGPHAGRMENGQGGPTMTQSRVGLVMHEPGRITDEMYDALQAGADEYGYYQPKAVNWRGPENWNFKVGPTMNRVANANNAGVGEGEDDEGGGAVKAPRKKRGAGGEQQYFIDFTQAAETDWDVAFAPPKRGGTKLTKGTKEKAKATATTLPLDVHYGPNLLMSLFTKPKWMIPKQMLNWKPIVDPAAHGQTIITTVMELDEQVPAGATDWYDDQQADGAEMGAAGGQGGGGYIFEDDYNEDAFGDDGDMMMMDQMGPATSRKSILPGGAMFFDAGGVQRENLVAVPQQVEHIQLGFARVARAVDVKTLKASIWRGLATASNAAEQGDRRISAVPNEPQTFQELLEELPARIPRYEQSNVSIPFCFISLLHLCNEKGLELENTGLDQLRIIPGKAAVVPTPAKAAVAH